MATCRTCTAGLSSARIFAEKKIQPFSRFLPAWCWQEGSTPVSALPPSTRWRRPRRTRGRWSWRRSRRGRTARPSGTERAPWQRPPLSSSLLTLRRLKKSWSDVNHRSLPFLGWEDKPTPGRCPKGSNDSGYSPIVLVLVSGWIGVLWQMFHGNILVKYQSNVFVMLFQEVLRYFHSACRHFALFCEGQSNIEIDPFVIATLD